MGYIGNQNIIDRIGEPELVTLTDNTNSGLVNAARVNQAIDYAAGIFDSYVPLIYRRPMVATPLIVSLNLDLALYDFWKDRAEFEEGRWKVRKTAHDDAIKFLLTVNKGQTLLDSPFVEQPEANQWTDSVPFIVVTDEPGCSIGILSDG